jgi:hypothetical protein
LLSLLEIPRERLQKKKAPGGIKIRPDGASIRITRNRQKAVVDLGEAIDAADYLEHKVLDQTTKDNKYYVVLLVCGASRPTTPSGYCRAGTECNIIWLKIDDKLKLEDMKSVLTESCFRNVSTEGDPRMANGILTVRYGRGLTTWQLTYDRKAPEKGLTITELND